MTETERTTPAPESATPATDLGLRPIYYADSQGHPDTRPCPAWCDRERDQHDIYVEAPLVATHSSDAWRTVASRYQGVDRDQGVLAPHFESYLEQFGQEQPVVKIRRWSRSQTGQMKVWKVTSLSLDDAQEIVTVLQHLIAQADAAEVLADAERNGFAVGVDAADRIEREGDPH